MRINKNIPNYLLQGDEVIVNMLTGELEQKINRSEYRLETAETVFLETKGKTIKLVRRFTDEQIKKLYDQGETYKEVSKKPEKTKVSQVSQVDLNAVKPTIDTKVSQSVSNETAGIYINETRYDSLRQASDILDMSKDTISRRIKSDEFPTYYKVE